MRDKSGPDIAIAAVAGRQGGMIARQQLLAIGLSPAGIHRRVRSGRLHPVYAGVYAVGHRVIGLLGRQWAAVLACGEGAALSHWSAGAAWRMIATTLAAMHVSAARAGRGRADLKVHRRTLEPDEITTLDGLPITTPARTTIDLAAAGLRGRKLDTRSVLEDLVLDLCDAHGIPRPLVNAIVAGRRRDFSGRTCRSPSRPTPTAGTARPAGSPRTGGATSS
jgi:hypothetical protein